MNLDHVSAFIVEKKKKKKKKKKKEEENEALAVSFHGGEGIIFVLFLVEEDEDRQGCEIGMGCVRVVPCFKGCVGWIV